MVYVQHVFKAHPEQVFLRYFWLFLWLHFGLEICKVIRLILPKTCKFNTQNSPTFPYKSIHYDLFRADYVKNNPTNVSSFTEQSVHTNEIIENANQNQLSDIQVSGSGVVIRTLRDDNTGSRHQRFILQLSSGQTLLISHNIDLAPKIDILQKGDVVEFYGEYEWNSKGGVVHWTHHDPSGHHVGGWLKHNGRMYE